MNLRIVILLVLLSNCLSGQNAYLYIEPYTSVAYDSTLFKKADRFSNQANGTEEYRFNFIGITKGTRFLFIASDDNIVHKPTVEMQDSVVTAVSSVMMGIDTAGSVTVDKEIRHINGFSCKAFSVANAMLNNPVMIVCVRAYDWGLTKIMYDAEGVIGINEEYELLKGFLNGVKMYTKAEIAKEEKEILSSYTVRVDSVPYVKFKSYYPISYKGIVRVNEKLKHTLAGAEIELSPSTKQRFEATKGSNSIDIQCMDKTEGKQDKTGWLLVLNSFGKKVKVPFSFSYYNK